MDPTLPVHLRWQGKVVGPFSAEQLRELIPTGAVTPASEISLEPEGPWVRLETVPLGGAVFPTVNFKTPTYERANTRDSAPIDLRDIITAAQRPAGAAPPPRPVPTPPVSAEHDVPSLLRFNQAIDEKRGLFAIAPKIARRSRRRRDYFILLFGVGALIFVVLLCESVLAVSIQTMAARMPDQFWPILTQVLFHSPILLWGVASFTFYAVALTWLMYVLMDDY